MGAAACLLLLAAPDGAFLEQRLAGLAAAYEEQVHRQSPAAIARRIAVVREIAHLPWPDGPRDAAAGFLARMVGADRAYRVRAEAIHAAGRIGTPRALDALYRAVFGRAGRAHRYALLYTLLPDALAHLDREADWAWIARHVLRPEKGALHHLAGHRADEMRLVTIEGAGRAGRAELAPVVRGYAADEDPRIRAAAVRALGRMRRAEDVATAALRDGEPIVRMAAARAESLPWTQLVRALADPDVPVRRAALRNLAGRPDGLAIPGLVNRLGKETVYAARRDAHALLVERTGEDFGLDAQLWSSWHRARARGKRPDRTRAERPFQAGRVLFVVDVSASMGRISATGRTMQEESLEALRKLVGRMPRAARFAALGYASEVRRFPKRLDAAIRPADVLVWLSGLEPAGASNCYAALMEAIRDPLRPDTVVLVTDGMPHHCSWRGKTYSEPEQILHEVREANRVPMLRIHAIGTGGGPRRGDEPLDAETAEWFLRRLARDNEGTYRALR